MNPTIFQACVFVAYVLFIYLLFDVLPSISDSWYKLQEKGGVWYSLFTWFCYGLGIPMLFQTNGIAPALFFLSGAGLICVGVATMFKLKNSITSYIHFIGATVGIVAGLIGIGVERDNWLPSFLFVAVSAYIVLSKRTNATWWIEITAFICIIMGLSY